jgi:hypothetical protein
MALMNRSTPTAAVTLSRTGPFARQGMEATVGPEVWAEDAGAIRWRHGRMVPVGQAPTSALGLD